MRKASTIALAGLVIIALTATGCETYSGSAAAGAATGAGAGAIIGHQSGHRGGGAAIGAVLGALTGLIVHDVQVQRQKTAQETVQDYRYESSMGETLQYEDAQIYPRSVKAGNMAEATIQYALLGTGGGTGVQETRALMRDGDVLAELSSKNYTRSDGTWVSTLPFKVPENLPPGEYIMVQTVKTSKSQIRSSTPFEVRAS